MQLRLVRYAVPLAMIGCLYYKVRRLFAGLCSSLCRQPRYGAQPVCGERMRKRKMAEMEVVKENDNKHSFLPSCSFRCRFLMHAVLFSAAMRCHLKHINPAVINTNTGFPSLACFPLVLAQTDGGAFRAEGVLRSRHRGAHDLD